MGSTESALEPGRERRRPVPAVPRGGHAAHGRGAGLAQAGAG